MADIDSVVTPQGLREALRALLERKHLSQGQVVARVNDAGGNLANSTLSQFLSGKTGVSRWHTLEQILEACEVTGPELKAWERAYLRVNQDAAGEPLTAQLDLFRLGVHRAITIGDPHQDSTPTSYVPRPHDTTLAEVVEAATAGCSRLVVLVGGSSTGKTRALWEALAPLRAQGGWRLWHPTAPNRRTALLTGLARVRPCTVVWLNESQEYLGGDNRDGDEDIAVALGELLLDRARGPVLIMGTLWKEYYTALRRPHGSQVRTLLDDPELTTVLEVAESFADADPAALDAATHADPRFAQARERAEHGRITQYLAGGPELVHRYRHELSTAAQALVQIAMDARRMGHTNAIPHGLLADATHAYAPAHWNTIAAEPDWLEQALAEAARPCKGAAGPLTRIIAPPRRSRRTGRPAGTTASNGPVYQLADYLDQHGRRERAEIIPPIAFWSAAAAHTQPDQQAILADAARGRGLYRDAAQLWKNATPHDAGGAHDAGVQLLRHMRTLFPHDPQPIAWVVAHASLAHPMMVASLLKELKKAGADEQVQTLLARDPAAHTRLDHPEGVGELLKELKSVGADEQVQTLLARDPAAHTRLDRLFDVIRMITLLREVGAHEQVQALLARDPAGHVSLDNPFGVAELLRVLREVGAHEQVQAFLARDPAGHVSLDSPFGGAADLLLALREVGADEQVQALADRAAAHVSLDEPFGVVADLLLALSEVGADEQVRTLLARDPATNVPLDHPTELIRLLRVLREVEADEQVQALADRAAAHAFLDYPFDVAELLRVLREVGAHEQVQALLARDPAGHVLVDHPLDGVADLLLVLREVGAHEQVQALADRAAADVPLDYPSGVAGLLRALDEVGADEQVRTLLARDPAGHVLVEQPFVGRLLRALSGIGADEQVQALAKRLAAAGRFPAVQHLPPYRDEFGFGLEPGQEFTGADPWTWHDLE
ncbi:helix-turn-helix domain-containing protein [Nocardia farcinica]|uniref:helix-turn-helix domain-containing protein n=1 Tax=Nocardia farcinica TaxID=37329 RepID=UPI002455598D|nr:helix-turn-helix transcriptional regulator [Nocardia farcinica]